MCHHCHARLDSFFDDPRMSTMENMPRRTPENFAEVCTSLVDDDGRTSRWIEIRKCYITLILMIYVRGISALSAIKLKYLLVQARSQSQCLHAGVIPEILGWRPTMLRWCSLHTVNLGIMLWAGAGCIDLLMSKAHLISKAKPQSLNPKA